MRYRPEADVKGAPRLERHALIKRGPILTG